MELRGDGEREGKKNTHPFLRTFKLGSAEARVRVRRGTGQAGDESEGTRGREGKGARRHEQPTRATYKKKGISDTGTRLTRGE